MEFWKVTCPTCGGGCVCHIVVSKLLVYRTRPLKGLAIEILEVFL
jgi:hypothetical protein